MCKLMLRLCALHTYRRWSSYIDTALHFSHKFHFFFHYHFHSIDFFSVAFIIGIRTIWLLCSSLTAIPLRLCILFNLFFFLHFNFPFYCYENILPSQAELSPWVFVLVWVSSMSASRHFMCLGIEVKFPGMQHKALLKYLHAQILYSNRYALTTVSSINSIAMLVKQIFSSNIRKFIFITS